jgi:lipopolysaccharide assembly outer membrane protein LptD (OstA)
MLNAKLTTNWKLSITRRYDLLNQKVLSENFTITRDLHCWEVVFDFDRYGEEWRYDFQLKVKALPEIKVGKGLFGFLL